MQRQVQANPPLAPNPPRTHSTHFAAEATSFSSSEEEIDSDSGSDSSYEMVGMAMEGEDSGSDSEEDHGQERKRQRVGTPGRSQSTVFEEEKTQIAQAILKSTTPDLNDMGEHGIAAIGGIQNRPSVPGFPHIHSPPTPPPQPTEPPQPEPSVQYQPRVPLFDHEPIDPVAGVLSAAERRQFGMISRNLNQWQRNFLRRYGTQRLSPEESFIVRKPVTNLELQVMKVILKSRLSHANVLEDIKELLTHYIMGIKNIPFIATNPNSFVYPEHLLVNVPHSGIDEPDYGGSAPLIQGPSHVSHALRCAVGTRHKD
jgi:hypothetical protein